MDLATLSSIDFISRESFWSLAPSSLTFQYKTPLSRSEFICSSTLAMRSFSSRLFSSFFLYVQPTYALRNRAGIPIKAAIVRSNSKVPTPLQFSVSLINIFPYFIYKCHELRIITNNFQPIVKILRLKIALAHEATKSLLKKGGPIALCTTDIDQHLTAPIQLWTKDLLPESLPTILPIGVVASARIWMKISGDAYRFQSNSPLNRGRPHNEGSA